MFGDQMNQMCKNISYQPFVTAYLQGNNHMNNVCEKYALGCGSPPKMPMANKGLGRDPLLQKKYNVILVVNSILGRETTQNMHSFTLLAGKKNIELRTSRSFSIFRYLSSCETMDKWQLEFPACKSFTHQVEK